MTTDTLDLPPITDTLPAEPVPAAQDRKAVDLQEVALAQFGNWRTDVAAARKNLSTLALDLSIPARIADAKTLRHRIINTPRAEVRKVATALKSKLTAVSKAVGAEMDAAVAAYDEAEALITPQIEAAEQRIENERIAREKAEADRLQALRDTVDTTLKGWADRCDAEGMTAHRVALGIAALGEASMPPALADVSAYWAERLTATRAHMERRKLALAAAELEAAQAKMRAEQERVAGIQRRIAEIQAAATGHDKASSADLAEARAIVAALDVSETVYQEYAPLAVATKAGTLLALDALHGAAVEREARAAAAAAEAQRLADEREKIALAEAEIAAAQRRAEVERVLAIPLPLTLGPWPDEDTQPGASPTPASQEGVGENPLQPQPAVSTVDVGDVAAVSVAVDEVTASTNDSTAPSVIIPPAPEPTMTLGEFNTYIAPLRVDSAGLESLGFPAAGRRKAALLYHEADKPAIVAALVKHLQELN